MVVAVVISSPVFKLRIIICLPEIPCPLSELVRRPVKVILDPISASNGADNVKRAGISLDEVSQAITDRLG